MCCDSSTWIYNCITKSSCMITLRWINPNCIQTKSRIFSFLPFQISINFVRKSTKGISLYMFCNVALANMLYAAAILLQKESKEERMNSFTFLLGSLGTISRDLVIFIQSRAYRRSVREE